MWTVLERRWGVVVGTRKIVAGPFGRGGRVTGFGRAKSHPNQVTPGSTPASCGLYSRLYSSELWRLYSGSGSGGVLGRSGPRSAAGSRQATGAGCCSNNRSQLL